MFAKPSTDNLFSILSFFYDYKISLEIDQTIS